MQAKVSFTKEQIAPCGINCGTCYAFLRQKNRCPGCLAPSDSKPKTRYECRIKMCPDRQEIITTNCYDCSKFACVKLKHIDKRYRIKYDTGLIRNLLTIKETGMDTFLKNEVLKWTCPGCGATLCVHKSLCLQCNIKKAPSAIF